MIYSCVKLRLCYKEYIVVLLYCWLCIVKCYHQKKRHDSTERSYDFCQPTGTFPMSNTYIRSRYYSQRRRLIKVNILPQFGRYNIREQRGGLFKLLILIMRNCCLHLTNLLAAISQPSRSEAQQKTGTGYYNLFVAYLITSSCVFL